MDCMLRERRVKARFRLLPGLVAMLLAGCATMGPGTISRDRFDYAAAIAESWKNQMLLNLVKARYLDPPVFLDIASAINSYSVESAGNLTAQIQHPLAGNADTFGFGASGRYTDRPTITYNPLIGDKFSKSLMTPIPPGALLSLMQAGWSAQLLLRCCVNSINGLQNYSRHGMTGRPGRAAEPRFIRVLEAVGRIQQAGGMGLRVERDKEGSVTVLFFRSERTAPLAADIREVAHLLGIDVNVTEFRVTYGSLPKDDHEVAILTRSMLEILLDMASYIDVPAADLAEHRATPGFAQISGGSNGLEPLVRVRSAAERPDDAFVAIKYRDQWFWIDDRDLASKGVFSFLMFLFTLTETGGAQVSPLLTVPAG